MMPEPVQKHQLYSRMHGVNTSLVKPATEAEVKQYAADDDDIAIVCGGCKFFERAHAQEEIRATQFIEQLVREHKWKVDHLCSPVNLLGFCGAATGGAPGEDRKLTGTLHAGCDQYREARGRLRLKGD